MHIGKVIDWVIFTWLTLVMWHDNYYMHVYDLKKDRGSTQGVTYMFTTPSDEEGCRR